LEEKMTLKKALMILAAGALLIGCVTQTAVTSVEGKAYVVKGNMLFGTTMYNCDATDGNPECWPTAEQERE
jgi:uncharacterized lipoprotein YajG